MGYRKIVTRSLKILICFIVILACLIPNTKSANASTIIKPHTDIIPSEYGTSFETNTNFNMTYSSHFKDNDLGISGVAREHYAKYVPHSYLESTSNFGKIWWQYNNAAIYNSKKINIRFTLMEWDRSWKTTLTNIDINSSNARWYLFARTKNNLGCFAPKGSRIKVSFFDSAGNPVDVKGYVTAIDMDGLSSSGNWDVEQMTLNQNIDYAYIGSNLKHTGNTVYSNANEETNDNDKSVWLTLCFSGTSFTYTYNEGAFTGFTNYAASKIEIPNPTKSVSTTSTTLGGVVNYEIRQYVPNESKDNYYTSFVINDTLSSVLEWNVNNVSIKSGNGTNVTSHFNINKNGNKLTISSKDTSLDSFYAKTYIITINTKVKNSSLAYYTTEEGTVFSNQATLTTNRGTRTSNTVKTNVLYKITTSGSNVEITDTMNNIVGGSLKTIKWTADDGYYVSKVIVDDKEVEVKNLRTGTYTFSNIANNHDVKVEASPCYKIDTEIKNGTITPTQNKIDPQENRTIKFSPNNGYYVSEIIIDGYAYSYKDYADSYTFSNIQRNHTIKVVCEPLRTITTEIVNGVIAKTMTNIHPDSSKEIYYEAFEDYYISSVTVDDQKIDVEDFKNGSYKFDPVLTDHFIKVVCQPKPKITTEIENGTITPSFNLFPGEDGEIRATAKDGYYISKIYIDDKEATDFDEDEYNYIFKNVHEDHHIKVVCEPLKTITTEIVNGVITKTISNIRPDSSKKVYFEAFEDYYISSVTVDDQKIEVENFKSGTYNFDPVLTDHFIKVVCQPKPKITTEVDNGTITGSFNLFPGEDGEISATAKDGYYISKIYIDDKEATDFDKDKYSYIFNNVHENHHIKVVCEPFKTITTEIDNGIITKTMTNIHPNSSKEVVYQAFEDYYILSVTVDDQKIDVEDFKNGSYKFNPVLTDHYIKVVCQRKPKITTEIDNGIITPSFHLFPGEDGEISATAKDGYYISEILIDGNSITNFDKDEYSYIFKNVHEDHHIYIKCVPVPTISDNIDVAVKGDEIVVGEIIAKNPAIYKKEKTEKEIKKQIVKKTVKTNDYNELYEYVLISLISSFGIFLMKRKKETV